MKNREMIKIYLLFALYLVVLFLGGCAGTGITHTREVVHERHTIFHLYTSGECVDVGDGLYVENEGSHIDVYSNAECSHRDGLVACNNVYPQESCFVGNRVFFVEGQYNYMELHVLTY